MKNAPGINVLLKTNAWQSIRHRITLAMSDRENATFTGFLRLPSQFSALYGPVLDFLLSDGNVRSLNIAVLGCSNGAEAYTIASLMKTHARTIDFKIHAYDIDRAMIEKARDAVYGPDEIFNNKRITTDFVNATFDRTGDRYMVKQDIVKHVFFGLADALDPRLPGTVGTADIVYAQNFLLHMRPHRAKRAFANLCSLLNRRAALFIDGMDIGLRTELTRKHHQEPLDYKIETIHNEARWARGMGWPYSYWGLEPFLPSRREWRRRYATIFFKK